MIKGGTMAKKKESEDKMKGWADIIASIVGKAKIGVNQIKKLIENTLDQFVKKIRRYIRLVLLEVTFTVLAIIFLLIGGILFISRYFELDVLLLIAGLVCLVLALIFKIKLMKH